MKIFRLEISKYRYDDFLQEICSHLLNPSPLRGASFGKGSSGTLGERGKAIFTPNPEICLKTLEDTEFLEVLQKANYLTSDGIGLYIGYQVQDSKISKMLQFFLIPYYIFNILFRKQMLYTKYGERICGSDLTNGLLEYAQKNNIKIAIIDPSYPNDKEKCESQRTFRENLSAKFPNLIFDFYVYSDETSDEIFSKIHSSGAQILFSTLGMKKQEISILKGLENCPDLRLGLGVGSSFDYHIGFQKRAPKFFRDLGFEWLYRIFTSPNTIKRLGRIYQALIVFPIKVILYKK